MKQHDKPLNFAERVRAHSPDWFEYAKRHGMTPEQYQAREDKREKAWRKRQRTSLLPFPLPDFYDDNDPRLPRAALNAVNYYRYLLLLFGPDRDEDEDQLKKATDVALGIRLAWSDAYDLELAEVPSAKDFKRPIDEDFVQLEQWFLTAANAIKKEIALVDETATKAGAGPQGGQQPVEVTKGDYDVFLCHVTEDKAAFVDSLHSSLANEGLKVFYDKMVLTVGDDLLDIIDEGLATSTYGIVIFSKAFFAKKSKWTKRELKGLKDREFLEGRKVILPVWYDIDENDFPKEWEQFTMKVAARSGEGMSKVMADLMQVIRPTVL